MKQLFLLAAMLAAGACSSMPAMPSLGMPELSFLGSSTRSPSEDLSENASVRERVSRAVTLLGNGEADKASTELKAALVAAPKDATALRLVQQLEIDPVTLLGAANEPYVVAQGDTMSTLAERHLGDPLLFYALSRYNGLASPNAVAVGKVLRMPIRAGGIARVTGSFASAVASPAVKPLTITPAVDQEKANGIRLRALESMNNGDVAQAVALLKQAGALNSADPAIQRDLQRALRIQSAVAGNKTQANPR